MCPARYFDSTYEICLPTTNDDGTTPSALPTPTSTRLDKPSATPVPAPTRAPVVPAPTAPPAPGTGEYDDYDTRVPVPAPTAPPAPGGDAYDDYDTPAPTPSSVETQCIDCGSRLTGRTLLFGYLNCC